MIHARNTCNLSSTTAVKVEKSFFTWWTCRRKYLLTRKDKLEPRRTSEIPFSIALKCSNLSTASYLFLPDDSCRRQTKKIIEYFEKNWERKVVRLPKSFNLIFTMSKSSPFFFALPMSCVPFSSLHTLTNRLFHLQWQDVYEEIMQKKNSPPLISSYHLQWSSKKYFLLNPRRAMIQWIIFTSKFLRREFDAGKKAQFCARKKGKRFLYLM